MDLNELLNDTGPKDRPKSTSLIIFGSVVSILSVGITTISLPFLFPFFRRVCLPYVPATTQQVLNVLEALKGRYGLMLDLGSGDGRIVIAAAKNGFESTGIELNPWLVCYSKIVAYYVGLQKTAKFYKKDLWNFNLKPYRNIVIFGVDCMMEELERKFLNELQKGTCIVACRFPLTKLKPIRTIGNGIDTVWVYEIK